MCQPEWLPLIYENCFAPILIQWLFSPVNITVIKSSRDLIWKLFLILIMLINQTLWTLALQFFVDMNNFFAVLKLGLAETHRHSEMIVMKEVLFLISFWKKVHYNTWSISKKITLDFHSGVLATESNALCPYNCCLEFNMWFIWLKLCVFRSVESSII